MNTHSSLDGLRDQSLTPSSFSGGLCETGSPPTMISCINSESMHPPGRDAIMSFRMGGGWIVRAYGSFGDCFGDWRLARARARAVAMAQSHMYMYVLYSPGLCSQVARKAFRRSICPRRDGWGQIRCDERKTNEFRELNRSMDRKILICLFMPCEYAVLISGFTYQDCPG